MNHLPQRVVNLVQVDLLDFQGREVLNQKKHETVIIRVMDELDEDALIVDGVGKDPMNESQLGVCRDHLHDLLHLAVNLLHVDLLFIAALSDNV